MTPDNIASFKIPEEQLQELIEALADMHGYESNVVFLRPELAKAA